MQSTLTCILAFASLFLFAACNKNKIQGDEAVLYGTWVKGPNFGDTLWFMSKNGKNIIRKSESFNAAIPEYSEKEYRFRNGGLEIKIYSPVSQDYMPVTSFTWTDPGREFTIQNSQLFLFMSSIITFTYKKI